MRFFPMFLVILLTGNILAVALFVVSGLRVRVVSKVVGQTTASTLSCGPDPSLDFKCIPAGSSKHATPPQRGPFLTHMSKSDGFGIMIDVGCNEGHTSLFIAAAGHRVFCFEPIALNLGALCENAARMSVPPENFTIVPSAVGKHRTAAEPCHRKINMTLVDGRADNSALDPNVAVFNLQKAHLPFRAAVTVQAPLLSLDEYFEAMPSSVNLAEIRLIKIDVQSYEADVVKGAQRIFCSDRLRLDVVAVIEYDVKLIKHRGADPRELLRLMDHCGFVAASTDFPSGNSDARVFYPDRWDLIAHDDYPEPDLFFYRKQHLDQL